MTMRNNLLVLLFSFGFTSSPAHGNEEISTLGTLVVCVEKFALNQIAKDDFFIWEHKPRFWPFGRVFGGWLTNSGGSNQYVEVVFDKNGVVSDALRCGIDQSDASNYELCEPVKEEGNITLRWFWFDPPDLSRENPGQRIVFATIRDGKAYCATN